MANETTPISTTELADLKRRQSDLVTRANARPDGAELNALLVDTFALVNDDFPRLVKALEEARTENADLKVRLDQTEVLCGQNAESARTERSARVAAEATSRNEITALRLAILDAERTTVPRSRIEAMEKEVEAAKARPTP